MEDQVGIVPTEHLAAFCAACVLDDREDARRIGLGGQRFFAEAIAHWYQGGAKASVADLSAEEQADALQSKNAVVAYLSEEHIPVGDEHVSNYAVARDACGNAENCICYVTRPLEAGADEMLFLFQLGTIPHAAILETIRNIGTKVIPHFRTVGSGSRRVSGAPFSDKIALVTGGGSGIGRPAGQRLAVEGAHVVVSDINLIEQRRLAENAQSPDALASGLCGMSVLLVAGGRYNRRRHPMSSWI